MAGVTYTNISFSPALFKEEVYRLCDEALEETVDEIKTWKYFEDAQPVSIAGENCDNGYKLTATNLKAWLYYYGTGTYMYKSKNPYLQEYLGSGFYNDDRPSSGEIVRRGSGEYTQLNYEKGYGTIKRQGSEPKGQIFSKGEERQGNMDELLERAMNSFEDRLNKKLSTISFAKFVITSEINV